MQYARRIQKIEGPWRCQGWLLSRAAEPHQRGTFDALGKSIGTDRLVTFESAFQCACPLEHYCTVSF